MPSIVQLIVGQSVAPTPNVLQKTGALISQGGTTLAAGTYALLTQVASLTPLLPTPLPVASISWSGGVVLVTTTAPLPVGLTSGDVFITSLAGVTPGTYNGTYTATVTGASTFTFPLAVNPGLETVAGTYTPPGQGELTAMVDTFFAQGTGQAVYVLELGAGDETTGIPALAAFITTNPLFFYSYLVPRMWDANPAFLALIAQFEALTAMVFFFVTTTVATYSAYTPLMNCVIAFIEAPTIPVTEFSAAAAFQTSLSYAPSSTNRMNPFAFSYLFGVTPYPTRGNSVLLTALKTAGVNVVGTGAEGGISNTILLWGTTMDGRDFTYWYSVDWIQLNADLTVSNAVINGSNNPLSPLYYDQNGINVLQDSLVQLMRNAITFGLATGTVGRATLDGPALTQALDDGTFADQDVVNAVPFITYTTENPGDYKIGRYAGLSVVCIPARGFIQIVINIQITDFISQ
jgi:hypothetical protein